MTAPKRPRRPPDGATPESNPQSGTPPIGDVLSRSFEVGYRALDDYVQHGQRIAQRVGDGASSSDLFATDVQNLSARMMRHASDMLGTWLDLLGRPERGADAGARPVPSAMRPAPGTSPPVGDVATTATRLRLRVASSRPIETVLELRGGAMPASIAARELRLADTAAAPLEITCAGANAQGAIGLDVVIPEDQPAGTYDVLLLDTTDDTPLGVLRVIVR